MRKRRKHTTTKNSFPKSPVTRFVKYTNNVNGVFTVVTDITDTIEFNKLFIEWYSHPSTFEWCGASFVAYIKNKFPKRVCVLEEHYDAFIKSKGLKHATKEEYEAENN